MVKSVPFSDEAWWAGDPCVPSPRYPAFTCRSEHLALRDGTKIALHRYMPAAMEPDTRLPTVMLMTPYFSAMEYRSPLFEKLIRRYAYAGGAELAEPLARYGFAVVLVDLRGSGGSSGRKKAIFMPDAVRDGAEILDWIVAQPWSNGNVGATGISAVGMTANWLLTAKHPALKAIAPRFTVFDIYAATHPGGVRASRFVQDIGDMLRAMDANRLADMQTHPIARALLRLLIRGLKPADDDFDRSRLAAAVAEHIENEYFDRGIVATEFRDDPLPGSSVPATLDTQSPMSHARAMTESAVPIYAVGGWFDAAFCRELIHLHRTVRTPGSRLTIGPWGHGGRFYSSPLVRRRTPTRFDHVRDLARFFAHHLANVDTGIDREPPIHYFVLGAERWKSCEEWPPPGGLMRELRCTAGGRLTFGEAEAGPAFDSHRIDPAATTGKDARFGRHIAGGRFPVSYPARNERDRSLLVYDSPPLADSLEVTGHPLVTLYVSSDAPDGAVFVYLEDVAPSGEVRNATDGMLRIRDRKLASGPPPFPSAVPWRTHLRADASPVAPGGVAELVFDLLPIAYRFAAGHRVRLAIAGADEGNFEPVPTDPSAPTIHVHRGGPYDSRVALPVPR